MQLLYPLTKDPAYSIGDLPAWLKTVRTFLEANGEELIPLSLIGQIAKETGLSPIMVETSLKLFGEFVLRKNDVELNGNDLVLKLQSLFAGRESQSGWEIYLRVGTKQ
jgi:hypothetical protein